MKAQHTIVDGRHRRARSGDWVEAHAIGGGAPRRGQIVELLGRPGHERYRVRWDEEHESILYPADGVTVVSHPVHAA
jgi:hypothetical protein